MSTSETEEFDRLIGDQLVTLMIDVPGDDAELTGFAENWQGGGRNPRAGLGV